MYAQKLQLEVDGEQNDGEDDSRDSHTRLVVRDHANPAWGGRRPTPLERAFAEIVLFDGANCVIRELDPSSEEMTDGAFDAMAITIDMQGAVVDSRRARYAALERNLPAMKMRRRRTG